MTASIWFCLEDHGVRVLVVGWFFVGWVQYVVDGSDIIVVHIVFVYGPMVPLIALSIYDQ